MWSLVDSVLQYTPYAHLAGTMHPVASIIVSTIVLGTIAMVIDGVYRSTTRVPFVPEGKHCYITGGSTGLGKGLAIELAKRGAHVTIVARRESELKAAAEQIRAARKSDSQKVFTVSADVTSKEDIVRAIDEATKAIGKTPEYVFTCAGASFPKLFVDQTMDDFEYAIKLNYLGQLYTVHEATRRMIADGVKGKLVFVSSILGLMNFIGYSEYSPAKHAIRGLADGLRNELLLYGIDVHVYFPGGILSPGWENENKTKPRITAEIEGTNTPQTPEECAKTLIKGLQRGYYFIGTDLLTEILRSATRGTSPSNNWVLDWTLSAIGWIVGSGFSTYTDYAVLQERKRLLAEKKLQ